MALSNGSDIIHPETDTEMVLTKDGKKLSAKLDELEANKQDNLEYDTVPTTGSENVVTSGVVYTAINEANFLISTV